MARGARKASAQSADTERLREQARQRALKLDARAKRLVEEHLKDNPRDLQAMTFLLHRLQVEVHDILRNLQDPDWVPKPTRQRRQAAPLSLPPPPDLPPKQRLRKAQELPGYRIPKPVPYPDERKPEDQRETTRFNDPRRTWSASPLVEVKVPAACQDAVVQYFTSFSVEHHTQVVRQWAEKQFGSLETARQSLLEGAQVPDDASVWRAFLRKASSASARKRAGELLQLADTELLAERDSRRIALSAHKVWWTDDLRKQIKAAVPKGTDLDTLDRELRAHLTAFHRAANSGEHTNPQFPYLSLEGAIPPSEIILGLGESISAWMDRATLDRFPRKKSEQETTRGELTAMQKELGKARRLRWPRGSERAAKWSAQDTRTGLIARRRQGAVLWDTAADGLEPTVLAIPVGGHEKIDPQSFVYLDGETLDSDGQLLTETGKGKSCLVLPLDIKHGFRRWYRNHLDNHKADADCWRRGEQASFQFVLCLPSDNKGLRLFIRPIFSFFHPALEIENCHDFKVAPGCRYYIGVDRGINFPYRAVVYDNETNAVIADKFEEGEDRKVQWRVLRQETAYWQQRRDWLRNSGGSKGEIQRAVKQLRRLRARQRALGKVSLVESLAKLVDWCEAELGRGNYCFVLERLGQMNLRRDNRVKHIAATEEALANQLKKRGYAYNDRSGRVHGLRHENPWYSSQISPSGWWASRDVTATTDEPIGRAIGRWYAKDPDTNGLHPRGEWRCPTGRRRARFVLLGQDPDTAPPRRPFGEALFWDRTDTRTGFDRGIVWEADFVGAFNLAVRPLVAERHGLKAKEFAAGHQEFNPTVRIACEVPVFHLVVPPPAPQDARGRTALKREMISPHELSRR